ncbi:hypothetical protein [Devosia sp. 2618]|uniref:hypothetical protein n=1 Tax=Devosia sp. 2618 TaxID=3156454 RepID=UPI003395485C
MIRLTLLAAALVLSAGSTLAQENPIREGNYYGGGEGGNLTVNLKHIDADIYGISIGTEVPMENDIPGCGGGISGELIMEPSGGNFFVENEDYVAGSSSPLENERYCEITLTFDEDGFLNVQEQNGCLAYHGASCEFTGQLVHESAAG